MKATSIGRISTFCALLTLSVPSALGHPGHFYSAFHAEDLATAYAHASDEGKLVFAYIKKPGGNDCPYLRWVTPKTQPVLDLLVLETIIVELESDTPGARSFDLTDGHLPAILLLTPAGEVVHRLPGDTPPDACRKILLRELTGPGTIERIQSAFVAMGEDHIFTRERLARAYARNGETDRAISAYKWCVDHTLAQNNASALARRPYLFHALAEFAKISSPGENRSITSAKFVDQQLARIEHVLQYYDDSKLAKDYAELNHVLSQDERTLALFDRMPADFRSRNALFDRIIDQLINAKRYDDVLALITPLEAFRGEVALARRRIAFRAAGDSQATGRGTKFFAMHRGALLAEALIGSQRNAEAEMLLAEMLKFDSSDETIDTLTTRLARVEGGLAALESVEEMSQ